MNLRGLNEQNATLITDVNTDVLQCTITLLRNHGMVIFEEALIRSGHRKNRKLVQWREGLKPELENAFGIILIRLSRAFLREQINASFNKLKVLNEAAEHLVKGNGNETAGYCFPAKYEDLTKRQISHRRHVAEGYVRGANRIEQDLDIQIPSRIDLDELLPAPLTCKEGGGDG